MPYQVSPEIVFPISPLPSVGRIMHVAENQFVVVKASLPLLRPFHAPKIAMKK